MDTNMPGGMALNAERLVELISQQQYLRPHQTVEEAIRLAGQVIGLCAGAAGSAFHLLGIDASGKVGRLRRSELVQLSRTIYRVWRQNAAVALGESQPA